MIDHDTPPLSREDREELAAAAINADRRNTPMGFLFFGGAVLALGLILLAAAWLTLRGSKAQWGTDTARVATIQRLATEYETLNIAANDTSNVSAHEPSSTMLTDLNRIAEQSGVTVKLPKANYQSTLTAGTRQALFSYDDVKDESLADLLGWVERTTSTVPGMRVNLIKLSLPSNASPTATTLWQMDVTFARIELAQ